jgi:F-type H+-transporting ATPase subunit gamma
MKRERALQRGLRSLGTLGQTINALKSLSAQHLRTARAGLPTARAYREGIDATVALTGLRQIGPPTEQRALLLTASDLGLCDGYNSRLVDAMLDQQRALTATQFYCVGKRPLFALERANVQVTRAYPAAASVAGLTRLLLTLADDVFGDYLAGAFGSLTAVPARFEGVGAFTARTTRVLPIAPRQAVGTVAATPYASARHLAVSLVREYLYSTLFELLLDALAAEHGTRLIATEGAAEWLDAQVSDLRRQLSSARRESSTQEVLDIAGAARRHRRSGSNPQESAENNRFFPRGHYGYGGRAG